MAALPPCCIVVGKRPGATIATGAKEEGRAHAYGDQREHIQLKRYDGAPAALEERPACPRDHRYGERKLRPTGGVPFHPALSAQRRDQVSHRQNKHRQRKRGADPEALRHIAQFSVFALVRARCCRLQFQRHATLRAIAGMRLLDFRVHRARVDWSAEEDESLISTAICRA